MADEKLLVVDNLKMYFHTRDGVVKAVDGVSYELNCGETLGGRVGVGRGAATGAGGVADCGTGEGGDSTG